MASENIQTDENSEEPEYYLFNPKTNDIIINVYLHRTDYRGLPSIGREVRVKNFDGKGNELNCSDIVERCEGLLILENGLSEETYEEALQIARDDMHNVLNDIIYEIHAQMGELDLPVEEARQYNPVITYHDDREESLPEEEEAKKNPVYQYNPKTNELVIDVFFYRNEDHGRPCIGREISIRNFDGEGNEADASDLLEQWDGFMEVIQDYTDDEYEEARNMSKADEPYILEDAVWNVGEESNLPGSEVRKMNVRFEYDDDRNAPREEEQASH